jgi:hypothetical protein
MARPSIDAGHQPGAVEMERAFGEAAQLILRDAESWAQLLPRDEFERRVEAFKAWQCRCEVRMRCAIERVFEDAFHRSKKNPISEARPQATTTAKRSSTNGWTAMHWLHGSAPPRTC